MIKASPRLGALLAGGAALVAFGLTGPAMADGANDSCDPGVAHDYCSNNKGQPTPAGNGNGNGKAVGKPGAGMVGKADDKNPPGQFENGGDANNGYECDGNSGIAKTNPAHTGCETPPPDECVDGYTPDGKYCEEATNENT